MSKAPQRASRRSFTDLVVHIHPRAVPEDTLRFTLSWGMGGMSAMLIFLLFITGILQLLTYEPSVAGAYGSVLAMYGQVPLGGWIRNIHHWSANLLVIVAMFHLLRVFLTGAIGTGRRLNWIIGLVLLFLVLAANFSGYLLPWDQLAYWAVTICTSMIAYLPGIGPWLMEFFRGGTEVGGATLANFYSLHIAVIPATFVLFMIWHFWLVRKSGGLIQRETDNDTPVQRAPAVPDLLVREAAVGLGLVAFVMLLSVYWDAPLNEQANPGMSPNPAKAPWYFVGFQELLLHLHPLFAVCVVPVLTAALLLFLPFWKEAVLPQGIWFGGKDGRKLALWSCVSGTLLTFALVMADDKLLRTVESGSGMTDIISRGYFPVVLFILALAAGYQLLVRKWRFTRAKAVMAGMLFCLAVLFALTIVGVWFRGSGMKLIWL